MNRFRVKECDTYDEQGYYEVYETKKLIKDNYGDEIIREEEKVFKGRLSDCEAYIRLKENNYM